MSNIALNKARKIRNDEFYTRREDIEKEMENYIHHFNDKVIYCNCDDGMKSEFFKFFNDNFDRLGIKRLIATCYQEKREGCLYDGELENGKYVERNRDSEELIIRKLIGNGSFDCDECLRYLNEADIIITNPPYSLFRRFITFMGIYNKKFIVVGPLGAIHYNRVFKIIVNKGLWLGINFLTKFDTDTEKIGLSPSLWYTNLEHNYIPPFLELTKTYNPIDYPYYDNYDAIEVSKTNKIPKDYDGLMGVPVSFLLKYNPKQFKIIGLFKKYYNIERKKRYFNLFYVDRNGVTKSFEHSCRPLNAGPALAGKSKKGGYYYNHEGVYHSLFARLCIKRL